MARSRAPGWRMLAVGGCALTAALGGCGDDGPLATTSDSSGTTSASTVDTTAEDTTPAATTPVEPAAAGTGDVDTGDVPIDAVAYQVRTDEAVGGQFQVQLVNDGGEPFTVVGVRLESAGFEQLPYDTRDTVFSPGQRTDLTTPYGGVRCDGGVEPAAAGLRIEWDGQPSEELSVPFADVYVLERIHARECAAVAFAEAIDMHLGPMKVVPGEDGSVMSTTLVLERRGTDEAVFVDDTRGSVLITPAFSDDTSTRELDEGTSRVEIPYEFETRSCLPHLLADVKKPFEFTVYVRIGDGEQQPVALTTTSDERDQLWDYVLDFCAEQR